MDGAAWDNKEKNGLGWVGWGSTSTLEDNKLNKKNQSFLRGYRLTTGEVSVNSSYSTYNKS